MFVMPWFAASPLTVLSISASSCVGEGLQVMKGGRGPTHSHRMRSVSNQCDAPFVIIPRPFLRNEVLERNNLTLRVFRNRCHAFFEWTRPSTTDLFHELHPLYVGFWHF